MRRLAFVLLTTLLVGLSTAGPAQGYWALFHSPHHLPHPQSHFFHHKGAVGPVQPITPAQVIGAIHLGQQVLGFFHPNPTPNPAPAAEPKVSPATTKQITDTGTAVDKAVDNVNDLLKLVRKNNPKHTETTLPPVPKTGAVAGNQPANAPGFNAGGGAGGGPTPSDR